MLNMRGLVCLQNNHNTQCHLPALHGSHITIIAACLFTLHIFMHRTADIWARNFVNFLGYRYYGTNENFMMTTNYNCKLANTQHALQFHDG
jgi:hypothetical protein